MPGSSRDPRPGTSLGLTKRRGSSSRCRTRRRRRSAGSSSTATGWPSCRAVCGGRSSCSTPEDRRARLGRDRAGAGRIAGDERSGDANRGERNEAVVRRRGASARPDRSSMANGRRSSSSTAGRGATTIPTSSRTSLGCRACAGRLSRPPRPRPLRTTRPADWSFEICADDVRAFCDALAIDGRSSSATRWAVASRCSTGPAIPATPGGWSFVDECPVRPRSTRRGVPPLAVTRSADLARRDYGGDPSAMPNGPGSSRLSGREPDTEELGAQAAQPGGRRPRDGAPPAVRRSRSAGPNRLPDARLRRRAGSGHSGRRVT